MPEGTASVKALKAVPEAFNAGELAAPGLGIPASCRRLHAL